MSEINRNRLKTLLSLLLFFFLAPLVVIVLKYIVRLDFNNMNDGIIALLDLGISLSLTVLLVIIYRNLFKKGIEQINEKYSNNIFKFAGIVILLYFVLLFTQGLASQVEQLLFSIFNIKSDVVENQKTIEGLLESAPVMMIISACLIAPIEEELLFRGSIKEAIKNKKVFITVSGLIFGLAHVTGSVTLIVEVLLLGVVVDNILGNSKIKNDQKFALSVMMVVGLLLLFAGIYYFQYGNLLIKMASLDKVEVIGSIVYILMGCALALIYAKENNIILNILVHAANNIWAMVIALLFL